MKKKIPRLTANFESLVLDNGYYVDKTEFIQKLENLNFPNIFFLRPRRFGKSLTLSMLEYYYGIQHKDKFEQLFGQYFIGQPGNSTPLKNSYYILKFSFSGISTDVESEIRKKFDTEIRSSLMFFLHGYGIGNETEINNLFNIEGGGELIRNFMVIFNKYRSDGKIYLLIDEYDHFTNDIFSFNITHFKEIVSRNGWVRKFYEVIKQFMGEGIIDRFFATGVTPVTLDSMTSGFNVAKNITLNSDFHNLAGFTETELRGMLVNTIYEEGKFDLDTVITDMRSWYNGSKFSVDVTERLYNPQMVISFLTDFERSWKYPMEMADQNVTSDYKKISNILELLPAEASDSIIQQILNKESISEKLVTQFNFELPYTRVEAISLLFYNGLLTIEDLTFQVYDLVIPNHVIKVMYWDYFKSLFEGRHKIQYDNVTVRDAFIEMAEFGKITGLVEYVHKILKSLSNRDLQKFSEKNIKMIFMTILMGNNAYFVKSEQENNEGYADLLLIPTKLNPGKDNFLLELKYLKKRTKANLETEKAKAIEQVSKYKAELEQEGIVYKSFAILFVGKTGYEVAEVV
ncbi:ATP-binding protein [Ignavibacteriales bacterium]